MLERREDVEGVEDPEVEEAEEEEALV